LGDFSRVLITSADHYDLYGNLVIWFQKLGLFYYWV
jgi:hypothetical protein